MLYKYRIIIGVCVIVIVSVVLGATMLFLEDEQSNTNKESVKETFDNPFDALEKSYNEHNRDNSDDIDNSDNLMDRLTAQYYEQQEIDKTLNYTIAIFGTDERADETSRSDIIMVIKYWPYYQSCTMISVPRDSRVDIKDRGVDKINHAYAFGGATLLEETLEVLFDEEIDNYVKINFDTFTKIIDKVGGVNVLAAKDYKGYGDEVIVSEGEHLLNGEEALFYVRFRSDADGDFGRINRQQEVIQSLVETLLKDNKKVNTTELEQLYTEYVETDMEKSEFIELFTKNQEYEGDIVFETYTLETNSKRINGIWYEIIDEDHLETLKQLLED